MKNILVELIDTPFGLIKTKCEIVIITGLVFKIMDK